MSSSESRGFEDALSPHINSIYGFIRARVGDRFDADDIMQETLIALWKGGYSGKSSYLVFALGVARHKIADFYRRRRIEPQLPSDAAAVDELESIEAAADIRFALGFLNPAERECVSAVYNAGLTLAETAEMLGVPLGTVKSRLFSARAKLRARLGERS